jgi:hypothetical protein
MEQKQKRPRISAASKAIADNEATILELAELGVPVVRIAERFGVNRVTLTAFLATKTVENTENMLILENN